jgi:hypothetical protein
MGTISSSRLLSTDDNSLNVACGEAAKVLWYSLRTFETHSTVSSRLAMLLLRITTNYLIYGNNY